MKRVAHILIFALLAVATRTQASEAEGKITRLYIRQSDGLILLEIEGSRTTPPSCATNTYFLVKDETTEAGKQQLAMLMSAQLAGRTVRITGFGTCTRWSDGEDVNIVALLS